MPVVADGGRHGGHLFGRGAVREHVPTGHEGEFGGGEEAVADHQLIGRPRPGSRAARIGVDPGPSGGNHDDRTLPGDDQCGGIEDGWDPQPTRSTSAGPEAELEGDLSAGRSNDAVDLAGRDAGVGQRADGTGQRDRRGSRARATVELAAVL